MNTYSDIIFMHWFFKLFEIIWTNIHKWLECFSNDMYILHLINITHITFAGNKIVKDRQCFLTKDRYIYNLANLYK